jgi:hypothetical protein
MSCIVGNTVLTLHHAPSDGVGRRDLNPRHEDHESSALSPELHSHRADFSAGCTIIEEMNAVN